MSEPGPEPPTDRIEPRKSVAGVSSPSAAAGYDAFISYSRRDAAFAAQLERAIESYSPPAGLGRERRRLVAFRDEQDLTGPEYFRAIETQLAKSSKLIVLCSPAARASTYVNDEIRRFAALRGAEHIVPVLLSGVPNNAAGEDDGDRLAFPDALCELVRMPLAVPYAGFDPAKDHLRKGVFYGAWYTLLANLLDVSRADIEERDRRRRARTRNIRTGGVSTIVIVLTCLTIWATIERARAIRRGKVTLAGRLVTEARAAGPLDPSAVEMRTLLGIEGLRRLAELGEPTAHAAATLRDVAALVPRRVIRLPPGQHDIAWSGDGLHAFVAGDSGVSVIGLRTGERAAMPGSSPSVAAFAGASAGRVGTIDATGRATLWSSPGWTRVADVPLGDGEQAKCGALSDDGRYVALLIARAGAAGAGRIAVWATDSLRPVAATVFDAGPIEAPARGECLELGADHLIARVRPDAASDTMTVALWRWRPDSEPPSSPLAIPGFGPRGPAFRRWTGVVDAAWVPEATTLHLVRKNGGVLSAESGGEERVDARTAGVAAIGLAAGVLVRHAYEEDPYVPLLGYERITLIDRATGATRAQIAGSLGTPWLTAGDRLLVTSGGRMLRIWRAADGQELMRIASDAAVRTIRIDPSARWIATFNEDGSLDVWDIAPPGEALRLVGGRAVATSADSRRIAIGTDRATFVLDAMTGSALATSDVRGSLLVFDPAGRFVAASTEDPARIQFGDPRTVVIDIGSRTQRVDAGDATTALAFTPDGEHLLLGGRDGSMRMTKSADGSVAWQTKAGEGVVDRVAFSADGALGAAGVKSLGGSDVVVFGTGDGGERLRIAQRSGTAFAFDRDASLLATAASDAIEVARVADGEVVRRIVLPETLRTVRHIAFSADGTRISAVAGSYASTFLGAGFFTEQAVFVWDARTGGLLDRLPAAVDTASDYTSTLRENDREYFGDIAWSGDGRFIAARVFEDRLSYWAMPPQVTTAELRVWDLGGGSPVETYRARTAPEERLLAIDASGRLLFTAGEALRVKDTDVSRLLDDVCQRVRRDLTPAEWRDHVSAEQRQRPSCPGRPARR